MTYRLRISRRAGRQIRAASQWWLEHRDKAPLAFAEDLDDAFRLIAAAPGAGQPVKHGRTSGVRRILLRRSRYHLYYAVDQAAATVEVLVLWHASRGREPPL